MELTNLQLSKINGGSTVSAALINALARGIDACYAIGRAAGSVLRRLFNKGKSWC